jgi:hypothetical protein
MHSPAFVIFMRINKKHLYQPQLLIKNVLKLFYLFESYTICTFQVKARLGSIPTTVGQVVVDLKKDKQGVCTSKGKGKYGWCLTDVSKAITLLVNFPKRPNYFANYENISTPLHFQPLCIFE